MEDNAESTRDAEIGDIVDDILFSNLLSCEDDNCHVSHSERETQLQPMLAPELLLLPGGLLAAWRASCQFALSWDVGLCCVFGIWKYATCHLWLFIFEKSVPMQHQD